MPSNTESVLVAHSGEVSFHLSPICISTGELMPSFFLFPPFILIQILTESRSHLLHPLFPLPTPSPRGSLCLLCGLSSTQGLIMRFHSQLREVYSITIYSLEQIQQLQVWGRAVFHAFMHKHKYTVRTHICRQSVTHAYKQLATSLTVSS